MIHVYLCNPGQFAGGQNTSGQNAGQNCRGGQNASQFWDTLDKIQSCQVIKILFKVFKGPTNGKDIPHIG